MKTESDKRLIYSGLLVIALLVAAAVLFLYYTQPFSENLKLKDSIAIGDINYQVSTRSGLGGGFGFVPPLTLNNQTVITEIYDISANIGSLELSNKGYFPQVYNFPLLYGCVEFQPAEENAYRRQFTISFISVSDKRQYSGGKIEVSVGADETYDIKAGYDSYLSTDDLAKIKPTKLDIYNLDSKEDNPLGDIEDYDYYSYYGFDCDRPGTNKPIKSILINL